MSCSESGTAATPLHVAAKHGHEAACCLLVRAGADASVRDAEGNTPLHCAAMYGALGVVDRLASELEAIMAEETALRKAFEAELPPPGSPLRREQGEGDKAEGAADEQPVPSTAIVATCPDRAVPLAHALDVAAKGLGGRTPLHLACMVGAPQTTSALLRLDEVCRAVVEGSQEWRPAPTARPDARPTAAPQRLKDLLLVPDNEGLGPLHTAAAFGSHGCVEALLQRAEAVGVKAAVLQGPSRKGLQAVHLAASKGRVGVLAALLQGGATVQDRDADGLSVLHHGTRGGNALALRFLLERTGEDWDPAHVVDNDGMTPFHACAAAGDTTLMRLLVARSRRGLTAASTRGLTPAHR